MPFELNFSIQLILERLSKESAFVAAAIKKLQIFGKMSIRKKKTLFLSLNLYRSLMEYNSYENICVAFDIF